ncbi:calcium-binding protein [Thalassovita mangrovi]|uniref:Hemolysin-type calcium-binding repeat-containing protein n=1 Tax=Thalassovita mangrovi TaxID=2692236 RepID=A0A6L8LJ54_9RHOB|nr:calcium-binding protein [Thalassovita mangrovi]MYM56097.1 hypothetical protein [Thalassovita mangrovi]
MLFLLASLPMMIGLSYAIDLWGDTPEQDPAQASDPEFRETAMGTDEGEETPAFLDEDGVNDRVTGTTEADSIALAGGDDRVSAGDGDDTVSGGDGADRIRAGEGQDVIQGNTGNDTIYADGQDDWVRGGRGDDLIYLGKGDDSVSAYTDMLAAQRYFDPENADTYDAQIHAREDSSDSGDDTYFGGSGNDSIEDVLGRDEIHGEEGSDYLLAVDRDLGNPDTIFGGAGSDTIVGDDGDLLSGGEGQNYFYIHFREGAEPVTITDFDSGIQNHLIVLDESDSLGEISFVQDGADTLLQSGSTVIARIENYSADDIEDWLVGLEPAAETQFDAGGADDFLNYSAAHTGQFAHSGSGNDTVIGGDGDDSIYAWFGDDLVHGGEGDDRIAGERGFDTLEGGAGDDTLYGNSGDDVMRGGDGNDLLSDDNGENIYDGGAGNDTIQSANATATILAGQGDDYIDANDSSPYHTLATDSIDAGDGDDTIEADDGDTVTGGAGIDSFTIEWDETDDAAVVFTDFDPATEVIGLRGLPDTADALTFEQDGANAIVRSGDLILARLQNTVSADLSGSNVMVIAG